MTTVHIIPHSHFDPEWTHDYKAYLARELPQIVERLECLQRDSSHAFVLDQVTVLEPLLERFPEWRDFVRQTVQEGHIELSDVVVQGNWSLLDGEMIVRNLTRGRATFENLLGIGLAGTCVWRMDVYGLNPQLPQILRKADRRYLVLGGYPGCPIRLEPSVGAQIPSHVPGYGVPVFTERLASGADFWWTGPDGSKILTHYGPDYEGIGRAPDWEEVERHVRDRYPDGLPHSIFVFSGGDLAACDPALPEKVGVWNRRDPTHHYVISTPSRFFREIEQERLPDAKPSVELGHYWGAYESHVRARQLGRKVENLITTAEAWATLAHVLGSRDADRDLEEAWYPLLMNHHHDAVLTCLHDGLMAKVFDRYTRVLDGVTKTLDRSLRFVAERIDTRAQAGIPIVVFNPLGWSCADAAQASVDLPPGTQSVRMAEASGRPVAVQLLGTERRADGSLERAELLFAVREVPSLGYSSYYVQPASERGRSVPCGMLRVTPECIENAALRITLQGGAIRGIYDKRVRREVFVPDQVSGNEILLFEDRGCCSVIRSEGEPERLGTHESVTEVVECGPVRAAVKTTTTLGASRFERYIRLCPGTRRIEFETLVDWHDRAKRIRVGFPSLVRVPGVFAEAPFAVVERDPGPVPALRWLEVCRPDLRDGLALINTGTPSYEVVDGGLLMTLFRSVDMSGVQWRDGRDRDCDWCMRDQPYDSAMEQGGSRFTYALVPHPGSWRRAKTYRHALQFNRPLVVLPTSRHAGALPPQKSFLALCAPNLVLSCLKRSSDGQGVVVRWCETEGRRTSGTLSLGFGVSEACATDLVEKASQRLSVRSGCVSVSSSPFEIKTVKLGAC